MCAKVALLFMKAKRPLRFGLLKRRVQVPEDFDAPMSMADFLGTAAAEPATSVAHTIAGDVASQAAPADENSGCDDFEPGRTGKIARMPDLDD